VEVNIKNYIYIGENSMYTCTDFLNKGEYTDDELIDADGVEFREYSYILKDGKRYEARCNVIIGDKNIVCYALCY
jgi:hypothetical protein